MHELRFLGFLYVSQGEGVAYRGRILVELSTQMDGKVERNVDDICSDDILVAQVNIMQCNSNMLFKLVQKCFDMTGHFFLQCFFINICIHINERKQRCWVISLYLNTPSPFLITEIPAQKEVLSLRRFPQRLHAPRTG